MKFKVRQIEVVLLVLTSLFGTSYGQEETHNGFLSPIWIRAREAPYSPIGTGARVYVGATGITGELLIRSLPALSLTGSIEGGRVHLAFLSDDGRATGSAEGRLINRSLEVSAQILLDDRPELVGHLSLLPVIPWRASPLLPANRNERDAQRRIWWRPDFDDTGWETKTLPDVDLLDGESGSSRLYRTRFTLDDLKPGLALTFSSDGGLWIYVNGRYLGQWGGDAREGGCVNHPEERCGENGQVPAVQIPVDWLTEGENTLAVKVVHVLCCENYFNLVLRHPEQERLQP